MTAPVRDPLDPTRKFSEGGAPEHRAALAIDCPACSAPAGQWCPMPGTTWNLCGARIDRARFGPFGGIMLGAPIPPEQPDQSKIIGVLDPTAPESEYPPIPPAGFYWARIDSADHWEPVEVRETLGGMTITSFSNGLHPSEVTEWGPALHSPGTGVAMDETTGKCTGCAVPIHRGNSVNHVGDKPWHTQCLVRSLTGDVEALQQRYDERKAQRLTYAEAQMLKGALGAALLPTPFGGEPEVLRKLTSAEFAQLAAAIARVTVQPAECRHEAWEWPMTRCPTCGTEGR